MRIAPLAAVVLSFAFALACTPPRDDASRSPSPAKPAAPEARVERDRSSDPVSVQLHVVDEIPRKPPLVELQVDVVILNHASQPRWVLLPRAAGNRPGEGGVDVLEVERWGDVVVSSWLGTGGFRAVRIGADARVHLDRMPVQWWRHDEDPQPPLEFRAARELTIDGRPAESYLDTDPTVVAPGAGGSSATVISVVRPRTDHAEVPVKVNGPIDAHEVPWPRD